MPTRGYDSSHQQDAAIVLVTSSFPTSGDGSEAAGSFVLDLAHELARHGPCRVVAPGAASGVEEWSENLNIFRYKAPRQALSTLKLQSPRDLIRIAKVMRAGHAATLAAVEAGPTRLILALWALPGGYWARQVARIKRLPYAVWTLGSDIWSLGRIPLVRGTIRRVLRGATTVYSDGIRLAEDTRAICGRKVEFLPSTRRIDADYASKLRGKPPYRMTFIGRWHPNKGIDLLMAALEILADSDWARIESVSIYGGGAMEHEVIAKARRLADSGRPVMVGGYLNKRQAERVIGETDWLLIPSRVESIPLIYSDALKLSVPVLATPVGDLEWLIRQDATGQLADSVSADAISSLIRDALSRSPCNYQDALSNAARRFDLSRIVARLTSMQEGADGW